MPENNTAKKDKSIVKKIISKSIACTALILFNLWALVGYYNMSLPDDYYTSKNGNIYLNTAFEVSATQEGVALVSSNRDEKITPTTATLKLFGTIPIKEVNITQVDRPVLIPGGTPFGIKLLMDGVMVIGMGNVQSGECPAQDAGIQKGDIILTLNQTPVDSNSDIKEIIQTQGDKPIVVDLMRDNTPKQCLLISSYSETENCYQAGMWVRDSSAGIGTVTFYDPSTTKFGGLGHPICDTDTGEIVPISSGEVVDVEITNVNKGLSGSPGELCGIFIGSKPAGYVTENNECGIFGEMKKPPSEFAPIPMAFKQEIKEGKCEIICTIEKDNPQKYDAVIERVDYTAEDTKNMVIRITDPDLLNITGGIVQGMSGSPIIQNNMIVGAVTHVFVNNPAKGYGIFIENMYNK
ncbi:MAG: SpoIVB peptidase [Oscillospiraceae bacterium]|jgi:stage IV sporulation protein B|nr:SpoIVB peptidase [Oscillospiraceae bacterium]